MPAFWSRRRLRPAIADSAGSQNPHPDHASYTPPTPSAAKCSSNRARAQEPRAKAADQSVLLLACSFQAMVEVGGTIPGQHLCLTGLAVTFHDPDLFGAPFFCSVAEFWSDTIWIDKLCIEARSGEYDMSNRAKLNPRTDSI